MCGTREEIGPKRKEERQKEAGRFIGKKKERKWKEEDHGQKGKDGSYLPAGMPNRR